MVLQACLGLEIHGAAGVVKVHEPFLPDGIDRLCIEGLSIAGETVDLKFQREGARVRVGCDSRGPRLRVSYA
jgi:hypothetical protein